MSCILLEIDGRCYAELIMDTAGKQDSIIKTTMSILHNTTDSIAAAALDQPDTPDPAVF
jgi:hypothetical protein